VLGELGWVDFCLLLLLLFIFPTRQVHIAGVGPSGTDVIIYIVGILGTYFDVHAH